MNCRWSKASRGWRRSWSLRPNGGGGRHLDFLFGRTKRLIYNSWSLIEHTYMYISIYLYMYIYICIYTSPKWPHNLKIKCLFSKAHHILFQFSSFFYVQKTLEKKTLNPGSKCSWHSEQLSSWNLQGGWFSPPCFFEGHLRASKEKVLGKYLWDIWFLGGVLIILVLKGGFLFDGQPW